MKKLLTFAGLVLAVVLASPAFAGMIQTPVAPEQSQRDRVLQLVERPEVARELEKYGIPADQAKDRVAAMSEEEVAMVAGKLDSLPAGGDISNQDFLFILIIVLVLVLLLA